MMKVKACPSLCPIMDGRAGRKAKEGGGEGKVCLAEHKKETVEGGGEGENGKDGRKRKE